MSSTATIFGSFHNPAAQPATAPDASPPVAAMFDSFDRNSAPVDEPTSNSNDNGSAATASIFESYSNHQAVVPAAESSPETSVMGAWMVRAQQTYDRWAASNAQRRAEADLWTLARGDSRIMAELVQARMRGERETLDGSATVLAMPAAPALEEAPAARPPQQHHTAGQGWGRVIEDAYQHRFHQPRHQIA